MPSYSGSGTLAVELVCNSSAGNVKVAPNQGTLTAIKVANLTSQ